MPRPKKDIDVTDLATAAKNELPLKALKRSQRQPSPSKIAPQVPPQVSAEKSLKRVPTTSKEVVKAVTVKALNLVPSNSRDDALKTLRNAEKEDVKKAFGGASNSFYSETPKTTTVAQAYGQDSESEKYSSTDEEETVRTRSGLPDILSSPFLSLLEDEPRLMQKTFFQKFQGETNHLLYHF